jgi:O-antigen/teichoic acid export membrane protein
MLKKISKLFSASIIAQVISFGSLPLISRMISPEEFGLFFFYASVAGLIGGIATAKVEQLFFSYEMCYLNSLKLWSYKCVFFALSMTILLIFILFQVNVIKSMSWLLMPLGVLATASIIPHYFYLLKINNIKVISQSRVLLAVTQTVFQLSLCYFYPNHIALLIGFFIAQLLNGLFLYIHVHNYEKTCKSLDDKHAIIDYKLLFYGVSGASLQTLNTSFIPSFFVIFKYIDLSGLVAALHRVCMVPVNLLASSISHAVLTDYKGGTKQVITLLWSIAFLVILVDILCYYFIDEIGFLLVWFLGDKWQEINSIVKYFIVIYSFIFLTVIVNQACIAQKMQKSLMIIELVKLMVTLSAFYISSKFLRLDVLNLYSLFVSSVTILSICFMLCVLTYKSSEKTF